MNVSRFSQPLIIAVCAAILSGCATTEGDSNNIESLFASNTSTNMSPVENAKSNRLRFRNGPLCLCSDGLQEADILNARSEPASEN